MTMLLGRSLVMLGDGFATALQAEMAGACEYAANHFDGGADPFSTLNLPASPELRSLFVEMLRGARTSSGRCRRTPARACDSSSTTPWKRCRRATRSRPTW